MRTEDPTCGWFFAALLVACGDPSFHDGDFLCGANDECPPSFVCERPLCVRGVGPGIDGAASGDAAPDAMFDAMSDGADAAPAEVCTAIYGGEPGFMLCQATVTSCEFLVATALCTTTCELHGASCLDSHDGDGSCTYTTGSEGCVVSHTDQICLCSVPP